MILCFAQIIVLQIILIHLGTFVIQIACFHLHNFLTIMPAIALVLPMFHTQTMTITHAMQAAQAIEPNTITFVIHIAPAMPPMLIKVFAKRHVLHRILTIMIRNVSRAALQPLLIFTLMVLFAQMIVELITFYTTVINALLLALLMLLTNTTQFVCQPALLMLLTMMMIAIAILPALMTTHIFTIAIVMLLVLHQSLMLITKTALLLAQLQLPIMTPTKYALQSVLLHHHTYTVVSAIQVVLARHPTHTEASVTHHALQQLLMIMVPIIVTQVALPAFLSGLALSAIHLAQVLTHTPTVTSATLHVQL